ncbi:hypothetical protein TNCV_4019071 [Trichonephila clavipes]|nr:hypothetical protein TNCV_4019071 [Trichonephila clavipes]
MDIPKTPLKIDHKNFKPEIKENYHNILKEKIKNCYVCGDSSHYARDCEKRFKPKESNDHIHNRINVNTLKVESENQNSDEFANLQYILLWSRLERKKEDVPLRTAYSQTGRLWQPKPSSLRAQAQ